MKKKYLTLPFIFCLLIGVLGFTIKENRTTIGKGFWGPYFYADNSEGGLAPEINHIIIANSSSYSATFYVCCNNDGFLCQMGGAAPFTVTVVVESDWSGSNAKIGIRNKNTGDILQCQDYNYNQGTYTFQIKSYEPGYFEIFTIPGLC